MSDNLPPDWAIEKATRIVKERSTMPVQWTAEEVRSERNLAWAQAVLLAASLLAEHEEPAVDPLLIEARELYIIDHACGRDDLWHQGTLYKDGGANELIREGKFDHHRSVLSYLAAIRRGIELAREQSHV